jgi:isoleucyl-tRNA synthetase
MADWKDTLNLPRTEFPMKANLQTAEPQALARWKELRLYDRIRERRRGGRNSCFTTDRPTQTARSTSAPP